MFQRKQTLYWIAAIVLGAVQFFRPYGEALIPIADGSIATVVFDFSSFWSVAVLLSLTTGIQVFNLFLYKKHALQIRLTGFNAALLIGLQVMIVYCLWKLPEGGVVKYDIVSIFPLFGALLNVFALKRVAADYALLRSLGRLR